MQILTPSIVAAVQMNSTHEIAQNLKTVARLIKQAVKQNAKLIVLPENFALMGLQETDKIQAREKFGSGPIQDFLAEQAKNSQAWIVGGTIPIADVTNNKIRAACLVYNHQGKCVARYDKIHLFDVTIPDNKEHHQESNTIQHGKDATVVQTVYGKLGIAVCYDIRFPELFRHMFQQGAEIFAIPTAFTVPTGQAHWEILARSRAIENFSYFIGACQTGTHSNGRKTYGHSLIIDPWGKILTTLPEEEGVITALIDLNYLHDLRQKIPIQQHRRIF